MIEQIVHEGKVRTVSGKLVDLINPNPADIDIKDIAQHLANTCRWNGATNGHYSVAQHSCTVASIVPRHLQAQALLHDAEEAYFGDLARPVKQLVPDLAKKMEQFRQVILAKYNINPILAQEVHKADDECLEWENVNVRDHQTDPSLFWTAEKGRTMFLRYFAELMADGSYLNREGATDPSINLIIDVVCRHYFIDREELYRKSNERAVQEPRQVIMYLMQKHTGYTGTEIVTCLGVKGYQAVTRAKENIGGLIDVYHEFAEKFEAIETEVLDGMEG